jgi:hypothetical protein
MQEEDKAKFHKSVVEKVTKEQSSTQTANAIEASYMKVIEHF